MIRFFLILITTLLPSLARSADLSGNVGAHFDYADRGLSLAREKASGSAALYVDLRDGLWLGVSALRVDDVDGNDANLNASLGKGFAFGAYELDLSVSLDAFLGGDDFIFPEVRARLSRDLGLIKASAGLAYAPDGRWWIRNEQTLYGYVETEIPIPRVPWLTAVGHAGYEAIADTSDKVDWGIGLAAGWRSFELSVGYEDSDRDIRIGKARVVAALRLFF